MSQVGDLDDAVFTSNLTESDFGTGSSSSRRHSSFDVNRLYFSSDRASLSQTREETTAPSDLAVAQAASFIEDALANREEFHKIDKKSLWYYRLYHMSLMRIFMQTVVGIHMLFLPIIEEPQVGLAKEIGIPLWVGPMIELICIGIYMLDTGLKSLYVLPGELRRSKKVWGLFLVSLIIVLEDIAWFITLYGVHSHGYKRRHVSAIARVYYLFYFSRSVQLAIKVIMRIVVRIVEVLFLLIVVVTTYSFFAHAIFFDSKEDDLVTHNIFDAWINFYIYMTTANSPDVMVPIYTEEAWTSIYFISFSLLTTFILLPLLLAVTYQQYQILMKKQMRHIVISERKQVLLAFACLDPTDQKFITAETWRDFCKALKPTQKVERSDTLFRVLNRSETGKMTLKEFTSVLSVLRLKIYRERKEKSLQLLWGSLMEKNEWIHRNCRLSLIRVLNILTGALIIANCTYIIVRYYDVRHHERCHLIVTPFEIIFVGLFVLDYVVRMLYFGPRKFFLKFFAVIETFILAFSIAALFVAHFNENRCVDEFTRFMYFCPLLRLFRLLAFSGFFFRVLQALYDVVPAIITYVFLQALIVNYVFGMIGISVWAGDIYEGNEEVAGTLYDLGGYYPNNFDNFLRAQVVMFELLVVNNWFIIASGYVAISGRAAWTFFVLHNLVGPIVMMGLITAAVLESFIVAMTVQRIKNRSKIHETISQWNEEQGFQMDYLWKARYRKRFRSALEELYGKDEIVEAFLETELGDETQALHKIRNSLQYMLAYSLCKHSASRKRIVETTSDKDEHVDVVDVPRIAPEEESEQDLPPLLIVAPASSSSASSSPSFSSSLSSSPSFPSAFLSPSLPPASDLSSVEPPRSPRRRRSISVSRDSEHPVTVFVAPPILSSLDSSTTLVVPSPFSSSSSTPEDA